ncbi:MAG: hypothetical protein G5703_07645 [Serratia symbiotica]|nr:hypothetical protein [Serratia symbiotica]
MSHLSAKLPNDGFLLVVGSGTVGAVHVLQYRYDNQRRTGQLYPKDKHLNGKTFTQRIERNKLLTSSIRIKWLVCKTKCG